MIAALANVESIINYKLAVITFGSSITLNTKYTDVKELASKGISHFEAYGGTPLGGALRMAKDLIDDPIETNRYWHNPIVILVTDGYPNDYYTTYMTDFLNTNRSSHCIRIAIGVGNDVDQDMLQEFVGKDNEALCLNVSNPADLPFKFEELAKYIIDKTGNDNQQE